MAKTISKLKILVSLSGEGIRKGTTQARGSLSKFVATINPVAIALAAVAVVTIGLSVALQGLATAFREVDEAAKAAKNLNLTIISMEALGLAAERGGSSVDKMRTAMAKMLDAMGQAISGSLEQKEAFDQLGLSAKELAVLPTDQAMVRIAKAIQGAGTAADKAALANAIFGRGAKELMVTFQDLAITGMEPLIAEMASMGAVSEASARTIEEMNDAWTEFKTVIAGVQKQVASGLAPVLNDLLRNTLVPLTKQLVFAVKGLRLAMGQITLGELAFGPQDIIAASDATSDWADEQTRLAEAAKEFARAQKEAIKALEKSIRLEKSALAALKRKGVVVAKINTPTAGAVSARTTAGFNVVQKLLIRGRDRAAEEKAFERKSIELAAKRERHLATIARLTERLAEKREVRVIEHAIVGV